MIIRCLKVDNLRLPPNVQICQVGVEAEDVEAGREEGVEVDLEEEGVELVQFILGRIEGNTTQNVFTRNCTPLKLLKRSTIKAYYLYMVKTKVTTK